MHREGLVVSQEEIRRYELLQQVLHGKLTLRRITAALGVSYRQAKRLKARMATEGLPGLLHGNRDRPPANKSEEALRARVLALSKERYFDCNDAHFQELLATEEGIVLSRETIRTWRRETGLPPKQRRRAPRHRKRRPRSAAAGLMMLWDGSPHRWFGEEAPACCLMAAIDDATGTVLAAYFCPAETSWAYLKLLEQVVCAWGVPASVYQDRHGTLKRNDDSWSLAEELAGRRTPTQVGAALEALGIQPIFALSPQAKGRIERLFRTLQDRLVACLRLASIAAIGAANAYLPSFLEAHNSRFAEAPAQPEALWRTPPKRAERERILSLCYLAKVGHDNAVRLDGMVLNLPRVQAEEAMPRSRWKCANCSTGAGGCTTESGSLPKLPPPRSPSSPAPVGGARASLLPTTMCGSSSPPSLPPRSWTGSKNSGRVGQPPTSTALAQGVPSKPPAWPKGTFSLCS